MAKVVCSEGILSVSDEDVINYISQKEGLPEKAAREIYSTLGYYISMNSVITPGSTFRLVPNGMHGHEAESGGALTPYTEKIESTLYFIKD